MAIVPSQVRWLTDIGCDRERQLPEDHLRQTRAMRRSRHHTMKTDDHGRICDTVSISERPATAEDRAIPGHWEGDLLFGSANSQIATLVECQTRYVMLVRVASKDTETVVNALIKHAGKLPQELYRSLTWDRGKQMADHKRFTVASDIVFSVYSQARLSAVARRLNERPRKTLGFDTPAERFHQIVASTG
jgi:IS30 family transposase